MRAVLEVLSSSDPLVYDLTTLDNVLSDLGLSGLDSGDLDTIESQITRFSKMVGELAGRTFAQQTVLETFHVDYSPLALPVFLKRYPVSEVISVQVDDVVADPSRYEVDTERGLVWFTDDIRCARKIEVTYTGGYNLPDDAPSALEQAVIELIREQRRRAALTSETGADLSNIRETVHGDTRVTYGTGAALSVSSAGVVPFTVLDLIAPYKARYV